MQIEDGISSLRSGPFLIVLITELTEMMQTAGVAFESRLAAGLAEGHLDIGDQVRQVQIPLVPLDQIAADFATEHAWNGHTFRGDTTGFGWGGLGSNELAK